MIFFFFRPFHKSRVGKSPGEITLIDTITPALERAGYQVIAATNEANALEIARREKVDLILLIIPLA